MRWLLVLLVACKSNTLPSNAPPKAACKVDADCAIAMVGPDPDNLCCDVTLTAAPLSRAYLAFVHEWRKTSCKQPSCKPLGLPGHPNACAHEARCIDATCDNACPR